MNHERRTSEHDTVPPAIETWTQDPSGEDRFTCPTRPGVTLTYREVSENPCPSGARRDIIVTDLVVRFRH